MASGKPPETMEDAAKEAVFPERLHHVTAATRLEATGVAQQRAERVLINADEYDK
jgi:hypothetical protein